MNFSMPSRFGLSTLNLFWYGQGGPTLLASRALNHGHQSVCLAHVRVLGYNLKVPLEIRLKQVAK
jgi:hypothetical protein